EGHRISLTRSSFFFSNRLTHRLSKKYGLQSNFLALTADQPAEKIQYGNSFLLPAINRVLEEVVPNYRYTNLPELNAILRQYNVEASRGKEHTLTYRNKGLHYHPLKADGTPAYEYVPARLFPSKPTLENLEKRFAENQSLRNTHRERLATLVGYTLAGSGLSLEGLKQALAKKQVTLFVRPGKEPGAEQLWFIDLQNKTVFEGAKLGKDYSFTSVQKQLISEEAYQKQQETQRQNQHQRYRHSF
ncbi:MAG TPA: hypothetical protein VKQ52_17110, partial [Puia sp.]|nr:hypothetical protein [Puia sp.]